jgi:fumarate reductase flavoprotein subunit
MSQDVAVVRNAEGLSRARATIDAVAAAANAPAGVPETDRRGRWELRNLVDAARSVIDNAAFREESRGAHYRSDFPAASVEMAGEHTLRARDGSLRLGKLAEALPSVSRR